MIKTFSSQSPAIKSSAEIKEAPKLIVTPEKASIQLISEGKDANPQLATGGRKRFPIPGQKKQGGQVIQKDTEIIPPHPRIDLPRPPSLFEAIWHFVLEMIRCVLQMSGCKKIPKKEEKVDERANESAIIESDWNSYRNRK